MLSAEEISRQPSIDCVKQLLVISLFKIYNAWLQGVQPVLPLEKKNIRNLRLELWFKMKWNKGHSAPRASPQVANPATCKEKGPKESPILKEQEQINA